RILQDLEILCGYKITPGKTLVFFDEVGAVPRVLGSLKYFCEDMPQLHVIVAGSLLGLAIHSGVSYPVGKVDELSLYPMSFSEFISAKYGKSLSEKLKTAPFEDLDTLRTTPENALREYYFTGGMPEVVQGYVENRDYQDLRNIQKRILADYALDISKHAKPEILGRIHQVWYSIPQQLAKSNRKFIN
ncbi:AAA family ATPase, partial [uncultured Methanobrevibacter sp.]|uniref:AAA family ATPase n=1 Tax=uncultured Methanobrevibacter sp. TaxID=253161 RepID=UPI002607AFCB